jgi:hypothetical protein
MDGITRQTFWGNGRFGSKTLEEFLDDLAEKQKCRPGDITMINVVLRLGPLEINAEVGPGREDVWEMMNGAFRDEIRRAKVRGVEMGMISVLIEPVMTEGGGPRSGGEEDEFEL